MKNQTLIVYMALILSILSGIQASHYIYRQTINIQRPEAYYEWLQKPMDAKMDLVRESVVRGAYWDYVEAIEAKKMTSQKLSQKELYQLQYILDFADEVAQSCIEDSLLFSVSMAQGLLESGAGRSKLARENHNHFGIKCFNKACKQGLSKGHCVNYEDDHKDDRFLWFNNAQESFRQHAKVLKKDRYAALYKSENRNYMSATKILQDAGYATSDKYRDGLRSLIKKYGLDIFDNLREEDYLHLIEVAEDYAEIIRESQIQYSDATN